MDGNLNKEEDSYKSFSGDGWDDYDDDLDYDETPNNKINQENLIYQKEDKIKIISPKYKKGYF